MLTRRTSLLLGTSLLALPRTTLAADATVKIIDNVELSGTGVTSGSMFQQGADIAAKEINAAGGILGRKIETRRTRTPRAIRRSSQGASQIQKVLDQRSLCRCSGRFISGNGQGQRWPLTQQAESSASSWAPRPPMHHRSRG